MRACLSTLALIPVLAFAQGLPTSLDLSKPLTLPTSVNMHLNLKMPDKSMSATMKGTGTLQTTPGKEAKFVFSIPHMSASVTGAAEAAGEMPDGPIKKTGIVSPDGQITASSSEDANKADDPMSVLSSLIPSLQGLVLPGHQVKIGESWTVTPPEDSAPEGLGQLFQMIPGGPKAVYTYIGDETRNGHTYAKVRMTLLMVINSDALGAPVPLNIHIASGALFFVDSKTGFVRYSQQSVTFDIDAQGQSIHIDGNINSTTELPE